MREYGLCLWTFGDVDTQKKVKLAKEIGVDGVEVQGNLEDDPAEIKELLKEYNLKALSVTPDNVDISSIDEKVRVDAVNYFLKLLTWAKELGADRICLHGEVGKITGSGNSDKDWELLVKSTKQIVEKAEKLEMPIVYEVLNRYENHQIVTSKEAKILIDEVQSKYLTILLDAYHMNIEESSPVQALKDAGENLGVYHIADSNRQAIGNGHANLKEQVAVLGEIGYTGPVIMEMTAAGPNPFTPVKEGDYLGAITTYYRASLKQLREWEKY